MDLECAICCNLLTEEPDVQGAPVPKRPRQEPVAGPSSGPVVPPTPQLCVPKCGHMFHKTCLINWIRISNSKTCPSCRKALTERTLTTVFLPAVKQEEKKCQNCEITKMTCEQLTVEKELFEKLHEWAEMDVNESQAWNGTLVEQLTTDKAEIEEELTEEQIKVGALEKKIVEEATKCTNLEQEVVKEKKKIGMLQNEVMEAKKEVEVAERKVLEGERKLEVAERKVLEAERKLGMAERKVLEEKKRTREEKMRGDMCEGANMALQEKFLQQGEKVDEAQAALEDLQECHHLLRGDIEDMTKKCELEQEKANVLQGRVKSLEATLERRQCQDSSSPDESSGSDYNPGSNWSQD